MKNLYSNFIDFIEFTVLTEWHLLETWKYICAACCWFGHDVGKLFVL